MTKQEIIGIINKAVPNIAIDIFGEDTGKNVIGCNQFRELANICRHSDCYEEIEMLIRYNEAKCIKEGKSRKSWATLMKDNKTSFANLIINCMQDIKSRSDSEEQLMEDISMFFGYLYWNARIWATQNKLDHDKENMRNGSKNYYSNGSQRRR